METLACASGIVLEIPEQSEKPDPYVCPCKTKEGQCKGSHGVGAGCCVLQYLSFYRRGEIPFFAKRKASCMHPAGNGKWKNVFP